MARMMLLASMESLLGSLWFGLMLGVIGYIVGHVVPVHRVAGWFSKK
jgi:hypothetical protein